MQDSNKKSISPKGTIIITGSNGGLGKVITKHLLTRYKIIGISRTKKNIKDLFIWSKVHNSSYTHHNLDLSSVDLEILKEKLGNPINYDHLVLCHGIMFSKDLCNLSREEILESVEQNTLSSFIISRYLIQEWIKNPNPYRSITYISSVSCEGAAPNEMAYGMAKRASEHMIQSFARFGIENKCAFRANVIRPGLLDTSMGVKTKEERPDVISRIPFGLTSCYEVARIVELFIESKSITGQRYNINSGRSFSNI